jgi:lysophospholipase L1-like esterase
MKNLINNVFLVAVFAVLLASCKPELTAIKATKGNLDLTSYVAIGNSLTSGYQNNGLYYTGQQSSYANVLANQFKLVEPGLVFNTPFVSPTSVGCSAPTLSIMPAIPSLAGGIAAILPYLNTTFTLTIGVPAPYYLKTTKNCNNTSGLSPVPLAANGDASILFSPTNTGYDASTGTITRTFSGSSLAGGLPTITTASSIYSTNGPFQNMGVPGVKCIEINRAGLGGSSLVTLNGTTVIQQNPFFSRFAISQDSSSILSDAMRMKPTFFTLFVGNNDILLWAVAGGTTGLGTSSITPVADFTDSVQNIVNTLTTSAKQGVIINISQITSAAFFNFNTPDTSKYIIDENGTERKMAVSDQLLLTVPQDSLQCALGGFGTAAYPIPKKYTLTANQIAQATSAIDSYNTALQNLASTKNLAFFDMNAFTKANQSGSVYNGMSLNGTFVTGGIFSLDGLHLTPRGYAAVANQLVTVINKKYGSTIPGVDLTKFGGVVFPQ